MWGIVGYGTYVNPDAAVPVRKESGQCLGDLAPGCFDAVLLDAPCSAEGNLRRYPEVQLGEGELAVSLGSFHCRCWTAFCLRATSKVFVPIPKFSGSCYRVPGNYFAQS